MSTRWTMAVVALALAGCNAVDGTRPWDQNQDGLITACEGLTHDACLSTVGCALTNEPVAFGEDVATRAAQGCFAPEPVEICQPLPPPPPPNCGELPLVLCGLVPACELVTQELCTGVRDSGHATPGVEGGCIPPPETCESVQLCVNRAPPSCESLPVDACLAQPGCALQELAWACLAVCEDDGHGGCLPCPTPPDAELRCVTVPPPTPVCETRSADECTAMPGCALIQEDYACPAICEDDGHGGCLPCPAPPPRCVSTTGPTPDPDVGGGSDGAPPPSRP